MSSVRVSAHTGKALSHFSNIRCTSSNGSSNSGSMKKKKHVAVIGKGGSRSTRENEGVGDIDRGTKINQIAPATSDTNH